MNGNGKAVMFILHLDKRVGKILQGKQLIFASFSWILPGFLLFGLLHLEQYQQKAKTEGKKTKPKVAIVAEPEAGNI